MNSQSGTGSRGGNSGGRKPAGSGARGLGPRGGARHNYRLLVEYDGSRYSGFQVQPNARTVAGELTAAARDVIGEPVSLFGAGRTDAGVHAEGQVVNFLARQVIEPRALREGLNDRLPPDINVLAAGPTAINFHSRAHALSRTYRYQISTRRDAFRKRLVWWIRSPVDVAVLEREARVVAGTHDFASFSDAEDSDTLICVYNASWRSVGDLVLFHITAERFARKMVRRLVGAMMEVALGRAPAGLIRGLLAEPLADRAAAWTAPPSGLFLESVAYPQQSTNGPDVA